jgi:phage terminase large subunit-like protein
MVHPCTQYALDAVNGNRVVGNTERLACLRHLNDLERQGTDEFPWVFDEERANRIYAWFTYCVHLEGKLSGKPIILEPFQQLT